VIDNHIFTPLAFFAEKNRIFFPAWLPCLLKILWIFNLKKPLYGFLFGVLPKEKLILVCAIQFQSGIDRTLDPPFPEG